MRLTFLVFGFSLLMLVAACNSGQAELPTRAPTIPPITDTPTDTETPLASDTPTDTPTATITPTATFSLTPTETIVPTSTFSPTPLYTSTRPATQTITPAPTLGAQIFGQLLVQADQAGMVQTIADMQNFKTRHTNSGRSDGLTGIDTARNYLIQRLSAQAATCAGSARVRQHEFSVTYRNVSSFQANLVLEVTGTSGSRDAVVVGAHYDTISKTAELNPYGSQPGADDNGSGVAAVLELARLFCLQPRQMTVAFVLFAAEEIRPEGDIGRVGSRNFVAGFVPNSGWRVRAMLNLDTIGSATDTRGAIVSDLSRVYSSGPQDGPSRQLARQIQAAAYVQFPEFRLIVEDREDRENRWGDHMSFTRAGYPAARLLEGSEDNARQDTEQDLLNDIDPEYLETNMLIALAFLLGQSEGAPPPQSIRTNGSIAFWDAVPEVAGYLVAQRQPGQTGYTYTIVGADRTGFELTPGSFFAVGSIGANGVLGSLSAESFASG